MYLSRCKLDTIDVTTVIGDFEYKLGDGAVTVGPNIMNEFPECEVEYRLTQDGFQSGEFREDVFDFDSTTGVLTIDDDGVEGLSGANLGLVLEGKIITGSVVFQSFVVRFKAECDDVILTPPMFQEQPPVFASIWKQTQVFFNLPTAKPDDCATFTYKLFESISGQELDPDLFTINVQVSIPFVQFVLPSRDPWLTSGTFYLTIEADYGSFGSKQSDDILVTVLDTCFTTNVTPQNIVQLTTFVNAEQPTTRAFNIFKDSVSEEFSAQFGDGSGYDLCAP